MFCARQCLPVIALALLAACASTPPAKLVTVYSDDGVSELVAPDSWRSRPNLGKNAAIRLGHDASVSYLIVNSYFPDEIDDMPLARFAERMSSSIMKRLNGGKLSAPREFAVNGRPAIEYEVAGKSGDLPLVYLSTVVDGDEARHHLVAWTLAERFRTNRDAMREVMSTFRESAEPREAKERTHLTFDWPERLTSTASMRSKSVKRCETIEIFMKAVSTVRPLGKDALLVSARVTDRKLSAGTKDKEKANYLERLMQEAMTDIPDYVVDREGEFVRVENLAAYQKRLEDALVDGLPESLKEGRAKARELARSMVNEQTLNVMMQDEWNNIVGNWVDGSYVEGEVYEIHSSYHAPALGDQTFPMVMTQQLAGRTACRKGAAADSCVRLLQTSRVSDPSFTRASNAYVRKMLGNDVSVDKAEVVKSVEVIADPDTLLPYRSVVKETKRFVVSARGAGSHASEETRESTTVYSY